ncbi:hypothetical protein ACFQAT_26060 [Undibacterium arcticum]|uniref:hypothetical protein n=1 Tax=Undibacterium arcticum TaxID=1762892 RepID=UPI00361AFADE
MKVRIRINLATDSHDDLATLPHFKVAIASHSNPASTGKFHRQRMKHLHSRCGNSLLKVAVCFSGFHICD